QAAASNSVSITGLKGLTDYSFRILATSPNNWDSVLAPAKDAEAVSAKTKALGTLAAPTGLTVANNSGESGAVSKYNSLIVSWDAVSNAAGYIIYYKAGDSIAGETAAKLKAAVTANTLKKATTTTTTATITGLEHKTKYAFKVVATNPQYDPSTPGPTATGTTIRILKLAAPQNVRAVLGSATGTATLTWDKVAGAAKYVVSQSSGSSYTVVAADKLSDITAGASGTETATVSGLTVGSTYTFKIQAKANASGDDQADSVDSAVSNGLVIILPAPGNFAVKVTSGNKVLSGSSITLKWDAVKDVKSTGSYKVYYANETNKAKLDANPPTTNGKTATEGVYEVSGTEQKIGHDTLGDATALTPGTTYYFKVVAVHTTAAYNSAPSASLSGNTIPRLPPPSGPSARGASASIIFRWNAVPNAGSYTVYYHQNRNENFSDLSSFTSQDNATKGKKKVSATTYTIPKLTAGQEYMLAVVAHPPAGSTRYIDSNVKLLGSPLQPKLGTPEFTLSASSASITLTWKAISGANAYEINYSASSSFNGSTKVNITDGGTITKQIDNLTSGTTYYFQMKAKNDSSLDSSSDSDWSKVQSAAAQ
ncbi:MAG: hypothetical protein AAGA31_09820, partial [Bacteroidota bacterium]